MSRITNKIYLAIDHHFLFASFRCICWYISRTWETIWEKQESQSQVQQVEIQEMEQTIVDIVPINWDKRNIKYHPEPSSNKRPSARVSTQNSDRYLAIPIGAVAQGDWSFLIAARSIWGWQVWCETGSNSPPSILLGTACPNTSY